jgi:hypothetical protein
VKPQLQGLPLGPIQVRSAAAPRAPAKASATR